MISLLLTTLPFCYLAAFALILAGNERLRRTGTIITTAAFALHSLAIILRWIHSYRLGMGHAPLSNFYESLVFFSWSFILPVMISRRHRDQLITFALPGAFICLLWASFGPGMDQQIKPLIPALKSNWLAGHVITCFLGYSAFTLCSLTGLRRSRNTPDHEELFATLLKSGFLLFSLGIITGSVWAHAAWGAYWSWDPKETWALITWLIYAALLHTHTPRATRALCITGLFCILFTYLGVNYLPGLHSYL